VGIVIMNRSGENTSVPFSENLWAFILACGSGFWLGLWLSLVF